MKNEIGICRKTRPDTAKLHSFEISSKNTFETTNSFVSPKISQSSAIYSELKRILVKTFFEHLGPN